MLTDEELFRQYKIAFHERRVKEMISLKKEWRKRYPSKKFYREYARF